MFNKISDDQIDSVPGPLVTEATALSTVPQPLPKHSLSILIFNLFVCEPSMIPSSETTHHWGKDHCTAGLQFNKT